jgi:hypothetical protein
MDGTVSHNLKLTVLLLAIDSHHTLAAMQLETTRAVVAKVETD